MGFFRWVFFRWVFFRWGFSGGVFQVGFFSGGFFFQVGFFRVFSIVFLGIVLFFWEGFEEFLGFLSFFFFEGGRGGGWVFLKVFVG